MMYIMRFYLLRTRRSFLFCSCFNFFQQLSCGYSSPTCIFSYSHAYYNLTVFVLLATFTAAQSLRSSAQGGHARDTFSKCCTHAQVVPSNPTSRTPLAFCIPLSVAKCCAHAQVVPSSRSSTTPTIRNVPQMLGTTLRFPQHFKQSFSQKDFYSGQLYVFRNILRKHSPTHAERRTR